MLKNKKIQIAILEMSPQNKAILEFYFDRAGKALYKVVDEHSADALIIDYDQPSAKQHVAEIQEKSNTPVLLLSIKEQTLASTIWLSKPLSAKSLDLAAGSVHELIAENAKAPVTAEKEVQTTTAPQEVKALEEEVIEAETKTPLETLEEFNKQEDNSFENAQEVYDKIIEDEKKENKLMGSGIALTGAAAALSLSDTSEDFESHDSFNDLPSDFSEAETGTSDDKIDFVDTSNENEVDDLLDSLIAEEEHKEVAEQVSEIAVEEEPKDAFLENLELDEDLTLDVDETSIPNEPTQDAFELLDSISIDEDVSKDELAQELEQPTEETNTNEIDFEPLELTNEEDEIQIESLDLAEKEPELASLDVIEDVPGSESINSLKFDSSALELEDTSDETSDSISEEITLEQDSNDFPTLEKNEIVEEDFTLVHDVDTTEEDIFANTLEVSLDNVKETEETTTQNDFEKVSSELEKINTDFSNKPKEQIAEPQSTEDLEVALEDGLENSLENDLFNFDQDNSSDASPEPTLEVKEDLELSLLDEQVSTSDATEELDDLDSLLMEINSEANGLEELDDKLTENSFTVDNTIENNDAELDSLLSDITPEPETLATGAAMAAAGAAISLTSKDNTNKQTADTSEESIDEDLMDDDLQSLLNEVRQEAEKTSNGDELKAGKKSVSFDQTKAEKRWMQLCGNLQAIKKQKDVAAVSYDANEYLLGKVLEQAKIFENNEQLYRLKYDDLIIVIDGMKKHIFCNMELTDDRYSEICFNKIDHSKIKIHDLDYSEERLYRSKIEKNPKRSHSLESFIWTTALLTSRGRLPKNTNITKKIALRTWPNLTRVESIPHAMQMAAVFSKNPGSLLEISNWLPIQQRYIFAFYNAALHLEMIELDSSKVKSLGKKMAQKNSKERGFFSRLLTRLKS